MAFAICFAGLALVLVVLLCLAGRKINRLEQELNRRPRDYTQVPDDGASVQLRQAVILVTLLDNEELAHPFGAHTRIHEWLARAQSPEGRTYELLEGVRELFAYILGQHELRRAIQPELANRISDWPNVQQQGELL